MIPARKKIKKIFDCESEAIKFAVENGIIPLVTSCPHDSYSVKEITKTKYKCRKKTCRKWIYPMRDTVLRKLKISFSDFFQLIYYWICGVSFKSNVIITGHSKATITRITKLIRKQIIWEIKESKIKIGGPGVEVQLDESKFGKRKNNRGHHVEGAWVFGGVDNTKERNIFAVIIDKRDAKTLNDIIMEYVLPGSIVVTDGWKGYSTFKRDERFEHHLVNHSISFKNEIGKTTNRIEGTWSGIKRVVPVSCRTKYKLTGRLFEFIWRRQNEKQLWNACIFLFKA